jgi:outer membrane protein
MHTRLLKPGTLIGTVLILAGTALGEAVGLSAAEKPKIENYIARRALTSNPPVISGTGLASGTEKERALTLEACVRIAFDKNPAIQAAREGVSAAQEAVGEANAPYYPELAVNAGYSRWERHAFLPNGFTKPGMPSAIGPTDDWIAGLKASYTLFDSGERRAKLRAAISGKEVAEGDWNRIRQDIALDVHQSYYGLISALEALSVAGKNLTRAEDHLRLARERKAVGAVPQADVVRAQARVADEKLALVRVENLVRITRGNLNTAMGLSADTPINTECRAEEIKQSEGIDMTRAYDQALHSRPEITMALRRVEMAQNAVDGAKSAFGPKVRVEGGYGRQDENFFPDDKDWMVGVVIEMPIFTGFSRIHRLGRTKAELLKEEAEVQRLILNIRREVWSANSKLKEAYEEIQATTVLVKDAEESVRLTRERYAAGAGTITELLDTQAALARAGGIRVEAEWNYHIAKASFDRSVGSLIAERKDALSQ